MTEDDGDVPTYEDLMLDLTAAILEQQRQINRAVSILAFVVLFSIVFSIYLAVTNSLFST